VFEPSEVQLQLAEAVRAFCVDVIGPTAEDDDEHEHFRRELLTAMGEQGFCGVATPERYGGLGLGYLEYCTVLEEIAKVSASWAVTVAVTGLPQIILNLYGTEAQRERWMPGLASGQLLGAFALSEPGSGSDAASLRTTAERRDDGYVLNGTKYWITHGGYADLYVVMARTGGEGAGGVSAFLVPGDAPGLSFGRKERKMGMRASPTVEVVLENVQVPADALLAAEGKGFRIAMTALDSGRITIGASASASARPRSTTRPATPLSASSSVRPSSTSRASGSCSPTWRRPWRPAGCWSTRPRGSRTTAGRSLRSRPWPRWCRPTPP
jgi:alkylation response protein AidB-like acyl-CoA dehydrogenase